MKKLINLLIAFTLSFQTMYAGGMTVTDVGSYAYYAQQLKAINDGVKTALDQVESLNQLNNFAEETNKLIDDVGGLLYNPTSQIQGIVSGLTGTANRFEKIGEKVNNLNAEHFLKNYHNTNEPLKDDVYEKWVENFEGLFDNSKDKTYVQLKQRVDEALVSNDFKAWEIARAELDQYLKLKKIERDQLKKYALLAPVEYYNDYFLNEETIKQREERQENIQRLIKQINEVDDLFKQQQTTNEILIEVLFLIQAQYELQMKYYNSVNLTLLNQDISYKSHDMEQIQKSRQKFDEEKSKDTREESIRDLEEWWKDQADMGKETFIYKMLDIHNNY